MRRIVERKEQFINDFKEFAPRTYEYWSKTGMFNQSQSSSYSMYFEAYSSILDKTHKNSITVPKFFSEIENENYPIPSFDNSQSSPILSPEELTGVYSTQSPTTDDIWQQIPSASPKNYSVEQRASSLSFLESSPDNQRE